MAGTVEAIANSRNQMLQNEEARNLARRIDGLTERLSSFEKYAQQGDLGAASAMFAGPETGII